MVLECFRGPLLDADVDAIVNAANTRMRGGGGIDGAIHAAAGPKLLQELCRVAPSGIAPGKVVITPGFELKQPWIIHAVGPLWRGGKHHEADLLEQCYRRALHAALVNDFKSIAFCSIATGSFGFPLEEAAEIAVSTVVHQIERDSMELEKVEFWMFAKAEFEVYSKLIEGLS